MEQKPARMKWVESNSTEAVNNCVAVAKTDYRDVPAAAEYPIELVSPTVERGRDEETRIRASDRKQYEE
jgi:hypothetical protein